MFTYVYNQCSHTYTINVHIRIQSMFTYVYNQCSLTCTTNVHIRIQSMFTYVYNQYLTEFAWSSSNNFANKLNVLLRDLLFNYLFFLQLGEFYLAMYDSDVISSNKVKLIRLEKQVFKQKQNLTYSINFSPISFMN